VKQKKTMEEAKAECKDVNNDFVGFVINGEDEGKVEEIDILFKKQNPEGSITEFNANKRGEDETKWISFTMDQPAGALNDHFYLEGE
jgi:hypothetical protein